MDHNDAFPPNWSSIHANSSINVLISLWIGLNQIEKHASKYNTQANLITNMVLLGLIAGLLGARFAYLLTYRDAFTGNLLGVFSLSSETLDISGGVLFGFIACLIYIQKKQLNLRQTLDALTPGLGVMMIGSGFANLASGDAYGIPTKVPWAIALWGESRHPTQIYGNPCLYRNLDNLAHCNQSFAMETNQISTRSDIPTLCFRKFFGNNTILGISR